jgi:hypothetical protein
MKDNSIYDTQLNDVEYVYKVMLFNNDGVSVVLSQDAIKVMVIKDSILTPFSEGYIILDNKQNVLQRGIKLNSKEVEARFDFNLGNNDYVLIEVTPKYYASQTENDVSGKRWTLSRTFSIYNTEDLESERPDDKFKKLYLWDIDKMDMVEKVSDFSTANNQENNAIPPYKRDDEDRMQFTGDAMRSIIMESLKDPEFDDVWDTGNNQTFYTSPINATYHNDLMNIYGMHQGSVTNDFCILSKTNYDDKWKLEKFSSIAEKSLKQSNKSESGEYQSEAFILAEGGEAIKIPLAKRVPTDYGFEKNTFFGDLSKLEDYRLIELSKMDAMESMVTYVAHSYDNNKGKFRIEHYDVSDTKKFYEENYSDKMKFGKLKNASTFYVDDNRLDNKNNLHTYTPLYTTENTLEYISRNKVLRSAYTLNVALEFSAVGMTHRKTGEFFSVQRENSYVPSEFESKLQGQWLYVSVEHVFTGNTYSNNIVGVKLNKLDNL